MSKVVHATSRHPDHAGALVHSDELEAAIQDVLVKLAEVDLAHKARQAVLEKRSLSQGQKTRLRANLEALHRKHREPLVLRLADLHYRIVRTTLFRSVHQSPDPFWVADVMERTREAQAR
jgi:hypothetical protein